MALGRRRGDDGGGNSAARSSDEAVRPTAASTPNVNEIDAARVDDADSLIGLLGLRPHPEGGWYAETWRAPAPTGTRPAGSAIYFLLRAGEASRWHRIDAAETWHHYAGASLELRIAPAGEAVDGGVPGSAVAHRLGKELAAGERPQVVVPAGAWQAARSLGSWTLVGCTVSPAFEFAGFELAPDGWDPQVDDATGAG